jgi:uncharacterized membrane protein YdjX (TVP38/TMEM64 family)
MNGSLPQQHKDFKINKTSLVYGLFITLFIFALIYISVRLTATFQSITTPEGLSSFRGVPGFLSIIGLQVLQLVAAFIPGQIIEIAAGAVYGPGLAIFGLSIGLIVATLIIFTLAKILGRPFIKLFLSNKNESRFSFLKNTKKAETIFFFIFLLPGIPKDVLIYLAPLTGIKLWRFIIISVVARIPGWVLEVAIGRSVISGNTFLSTILIILFVIITILGIVLKKPITRFLEKRAAR